MSEVPKLIKEYGGIGAIIALFLGGGANVLSESDEDTVISELRQENAELRKMYNALDKQVALMRQAIELTGLEFNIE